MQREIKMKKLKANDRIITSLIDTDLYKLTMMQAYFHKYPNVHTEFKFIDRKKMGLEKYFSEIRSQLMMACDLSFQDSELRYLSEKAFIRQDFIDYLKMFKLDKDHIHIKLDDDGKMEIKFSGPVVQVTLWEIICMTIVSEVWNKNENPNLDLTNGRIKLVEKLKFLADQDDLDGMTFMEFGTRRRFSKKWQLEVVSNIKKFGCEKFVGTSNIWIAKELGIPCLGTHGHEWFQIHQALYPLHKSQQAALEVWADEYKGSSLGTALTDVIGMDSFINDFDFNLARLFDGLRHDSGCPFKWGEKGIQLYKDRNLDPTTKTLIFSDGLDMDLAVKIFRHFKGRIKISFGIGTNLTNDVGVKALNMVVKNTYTNGQPTAKLTDSEGKTVCEDEEYVAYLLNLKKRWPENYKNAS
jgi:nicotinate phosphoribosyltransferase